MIYTLRKLGTAVVTVLVAVVVAFVMIRLSPGDPVYVLIGDEASDADVAQAREAFGLTRPIWEQLGIYLWKAIRLDFGNSIIQGTPAAEMVVGRIPATLTLAVVTMALVIAISLPIGLAAGVRRRGLVDRLSGLGAFVALSLPSFWVGIVLILVMARWLHLLPSSGAGSPAAIVMPAVTMALPLAAINLRLLRNETIGVLNAPYVTLARSRGLPAATILRSHVLRNAIIPAITVAGVQFGRLLGGVAVIETVFGWPGLGELLIRSIGNRDYPVVQASIIVITAMVVGANLLVDLAYRYIDPRFRT